MPSVSAKQRRFMQAVSHDPAFSAKVGVPRTVGREYAAADAATPALSTPGGAVRAGGYFDPLGGKRKR